MGARKRILVVDDSADLREFYQFLLEDAGYEVSVASSGEEGLDQARAHRPDLIILDVVMPGMGGLEMLTRIRSDLAPPVPPVILSSGFDITEGEALRLGALMFVRKPVEPEYLLAYVEQGVQGQPVSAEMDARQRALSSAARQHAREKAAELVRGIRAHASSMKILEERKSVHLRWLADYFGVGTAVLSLLQDDRLAVLGASGDPLFSQGTDLADKVPQASEILETGTSLVIPDASIHPCFSAVLGHVAGLRFFAGVPLLASDRTSTGVLCVLDAQPRAIAAEDLIILEHFGRVAFSILGLLARGQPTSEPYHSPGVWARETFSLLTDAEARLLHREGGSMELVMIQVDDILVVNEAVANAAARERLAASVWDSGRVAILKRDRADGAARQLEAVLGAVRAAGPVHAAGAVSIAGSSPPAIGGQDLLHLAEVALENARQTGGGTHRLVLQHEVSAPTQ